MLDRADRGNAQTLRQASPGLRRRSQSISRRPIAALSLFPHPQQRWVAGVDEVDLRPLTSSTRCLHGHIVSAAARSCRAETSMVVDAVWLVAGSWRRMRTCGSSCGSRRTIDSPRKTKEAMAGKGELVVHAFPAANFTVWARENRCGSVRVSWSDITINHVCRCDLPAPHCQVRRACDCNQALQLARLIS